MATYEYCCAWCGPFERQADSRSAGKPADCPACGGPAPRTFSAPGGRNPRRERQLDGVGAAGRERIERAQTGKPQVGTPTGRHRHGPQPTVRRPWQVGH